MDLRLGGKSAIITGGSRGIGRSIALRLAEEGCKVAICARTPKDLHDTAELLRARNTLTLAVVADVSRREEVDRFIAEAAAALGGVDLLVANAGGSVGGGLLEATPEDWVRTLELNLLHAVSAVRAAAPHMQSRGGGSALLVASISGWKPVHRRAQYATSKAAQIHLARVLAKELAAFRIRVNAISPGSVMFPGSGWDQFAKADPEAFTRFEREQLPWGRFGAPEEIADVAAFLLSERALWINGANIPVDGAQDAPSAW